MSPVPLNRRVAALAVACALIVTAACSAAPSCPKGEQCPALAFPRTPEQRTAVFSGLGAWWDVYDWSPSFSAGSKLEVADVDRLADAGVQVLYIQSAKANRPELLLDAEKFSSIVDRAHARGMRVVSWYLPAHLDVKGDVARLVEPLKYGVDGIALDIESTDNPDLEARNKAMVFTTWFTRLVLPQVPMAAIVLPPVVTEVLNTRYWPQFPWDKIAKSYDAWMPMGYWTNRTTASGWRDGERYTNENIDRLRALLGNPTAPVHPVGGIANEVTADEVAGYVRAAQSRGAIGGSLYDDRTSGSDHYVQLQPLRR